MPKHRSLSASQMTTLAFLLLLAALLLMPQTAIEAAAAGLALWWQKVLPSLLPFFMTAELLLARGITSGAERLLAPLCRLFRLPGAAAPAVLLGCFAGFPAGAAVCAELLEQGRIGKKQAERLLCFSNNCSPLFITATVCTALFGLPQAGAPLLLLHYGVSLGYGLLAARFAKEERAAESPLSPSPAAALPPFGALLKQAALNSFSRVSLIGCYMVFFSLLCAVCERTGIFRLLAAPLTLLGMEAPLADALLRGLTELTLGTARAASLHTPQAFALCAALLSCGGLCVQAQVAAMVAEHRLDLRPYLLSCLLKGIAAYMLALPLCRALPLDAAALPPPAVTVSPLSYALCCCLPLLISLRRR